MPALDAREHLAQLAALGLGIRQIAALAAVAPSTVAAVRAGVVETLRPSTAAKLLAARPIVAPGALVPATKSWRAIDSLEREGYTRRELAYLLGHRSQQLQLAKRHIRAKTARHVAALYHQLAAI